MQILLQSSCNKLFWKILCLLSLLAYIGIAARDYVAYRLASSEQPRAIEQAIVLDPSNAGYRNRLGEYFMFSEQRPDLAIPRYKSAVALNPHNADYWLDLASAYASTGASEQQERVLERALEVDPNTPLVSREVANAFLVRGDLQKAFGIFRILLQTDPWQTEPTLQICWQATHNIDMMNYVLPPTPGVYLALLKLLTGEGNTEAAERIWSRLVALQQPFDPQLATPYFEYLIAQHDVAAAYAAWNDMARIDPSLRSYRASAANLVVNGGFEERLLNMGFDWRYEVHPDVTLALDTQQFHDGSRSLSVTFGGAAVVDTGLSQLIAVDPNTRYNFSAYVRTDDIFAAHGPQFAISDAYTKNVLLLTEELLGTTGWRQVSGSFKTAPRTGLVLLKITRASSAGRITGGLWIDDIVLARE
jgi:tetratricopeptide (TPR) repeat protein